MVRLGFFPLNLFADITDTAHLSLSKGLQQWFDKLTMSGYWSGVPLTTNGN